MACLVAGVPLSILVSALVARIGALARFASCPAGVVMLGVAWLVGSRLIVNHSILASSAAGLAAGLLCLWLLRPGKTPAAAATLLAGLAMLSAAMASFTWLAGVGTAIAMVSAILLAGLRAAADLASPGDEARCTLAPFGFGAAYAVYRLVEITAGSQAGSLAVTDHHAAFAVMVGLALPGLAPPFLSGGLGRFGSILRLAVVGVASVLVPLAFVMLWGEKTAFALMLGACLAPLAAGAWTGMPVTGMAGAWSSAVALAVGLLMAQWLGRVLEWTDMARADRGRIVLYVAAAAAILLLVAELQARIAARMAARSTRKAPTA